MIASLGCLAVRIRLGTASVTIVRSGATLPDDEAFHAIDESVSTVASTNASVVLRVDLGSSRPRVTLAEQSAYAFYVSADSGPPASLELGGTHIVPFVAFDDTAAFAWNTGNAIGWLHILAAWPGQARADLCRVWIAPKKLSADADFEWLVDDIARSVRALAFDLAGATTLPWARTAEPPSYEYEDLVFLRSVMADVEAAVRRIDRRPHERLIREMPWRDVSQGGALDSARLADVVARRDALALVKGGARQVWLRPEIAGLLQTKDGRRLTVSRVPVIEQARDRDTYENRFVRFVLETFRRRAAAIAARAQERARIGVASEAEEIAARCSRLLDLPFLDGVGTLTVMQATSQVLLREDAYFRVLRAYLEYLLAADVLWVDDELTRIQEIHDVATLYEMWVFIEAVKSVIRVTTGTISAPDDVQPAIRVDDKGLVVQLKRGAPSGITVRDGSATTTVYYNRSFGVSSPPSPWRSWSLPLRPDVTVERTEGGRRQVVVLDAKYRVERLGKAFSSEDEDTAAPEVADAATFQRADVYKMHTYRDALTSVHAAVAIYPGVAQEPAMFTDPAADGAVGAVALAPGAYYDHTHIDDALRWTLGLA